jgi:hypothetical protein
MSEHPTTTANWDVIFDARGHFREPHTNASVPLGTLEVRQYLRGGRRDAPVAARGLFPTHGPENRFGAVLFIEKEGFLPLFHRARLAEQFDLAIMSTKGMSVVAARTLVDGLCGRHRVPLLVLRDFDIAGFSILGMLTRDSRRYTFSNRIEVVDLGLRQADVMSCQLESEEVFFDNSEARRHTLRRNGASEEEIEFLAGQRQRVELNAFDSGGLVNWLRAKLKAVGVKKVLPEAGALEAAYRRAFVRQSVRLTIPEIVARAKRQLGESVRADALLKLVEEELAARPHLAWDAALARVAAKVLAGQAAAGGAAERRQG